MTPSNEPLLTAYAFGELEGDELAQADALLNSESAARTEVEHLRALAGAMSLALADEPIPSAKPAPSELAENRSRRLSLRWSLQIAAAVAVGVGLGRFTLPRKQALPVNVTATENRSESPQSALPTVNFPPSPRDLTVAIPRARLIDQPSSNLLSASAIADFVSAIPSTPSGQPRDSIERPRPGDKIYYYSPDPKFEHLTLYSGKTAQAALLVSVPAADVDRGFVIWAEPKGQPPVKAAPAKPQPAPGVQPRK